MKRGFTLIELLVVVGILAVLIAILLPALGRAKENARKTVCATQLKGQGQSLATYASAEGDYLPAGPVYDDGVNTATWLHDNRVEFSDTIMNVKTTNTMSKESMRKWFYCPSNQEYNLDAYWQATGPAGSNRRLGYTYLNYRNISPANLYTTVKPAKRDSPKLDWRKKWSGTPFAGRSEVISDLIMSVGDPNVAGTSFVATQASTGTFVTSVSHLARGGKPEGANTLFMDGHAEWLPWPGPTKIHWVPCGGGPSGNTNFSIIDP